MKTKILPFIFLLMLVGCVKEPIIKYEYIQVETPVMYKLERPLRPKFINKSIPGYVSELLTYTKMLEVIIDQTNKKDSK